MPNDTTLSRRRLLRAVLDAGLLLGGSSLLAACSQPPGTSAPSGPPQGGGGGGAPSVTFYEQWQNGKQVTVWPPDQVGGPIQYPAKPFSQR